MNILKKSNLTAHCNTSKGCVLIFFPQKSSYLIYKREKKILSQKIPEGHVSCPLLCVLWLVWWSVNVRRGDLEQCRCALYFRVSWICPMSFFWCLTFFSPWQQLVFKGRGALCISLERTVSVTPVTFSRFHIILDVKNQVIKQTDLEVTIICKPPRYNLVHFNISIL